MNPSCQLFLKDGLVYVFSEAVLANTRARTTGDLTAKYPEDVDSNALGREIRAALRSFGGARTLDQSKADAPFRQIEGFTSMKKLMKNLGDVRVSEDGDKKYLRMQPMKSQGKNSISIAGEKKDLLLECPDSELGAEALRLLKLSQDVNS